jgi:unsaturated chondroitin disaccharide hydrolase
MGRNWTEIADKIIRKEEKVAARNKGKIPYTAKDHVFDDRSDKKDICWWTNGFYGGMMWQLFNATGNELFKECAVKLEEQMDAAFLNYNGMDHDAGFRWLPTAVADYRLFAGEDSKNRGLLAAASLAGRFNLNGNFIRAWNDWGDDRDTTGWAIIDCMMNLPLLYWASDVLGDPRFKDIAIAHANTAQDYFIREDGSVRHIVGFDPVTGEFDREYGGQGYGEGSSWTRGQTWALYGFTLSFIHTGDRNYLETAIKVADRFCDRIPEDGLIPVDFDQPGEPSYIDSTAAAIASCGLITLAKELEKIGEAGSDRYLEAAEKMLSALDEKDCDYDPEHDELLTRCSASYHDKDHEFPIIYGDYYYIEAIWKLTDKELFIW